ncbi:MAG: hypothetical protein AB2A00_15930 [Myxococcota bacterium]
MRPRRKRTRRVSLYDENMWPVDRLHDVMPRLMAVVAPHAEALEADGHPLAGLMGERLRRSLCRLGPLLDEALEELSALQHASYQVAASTANLKDQMRAAFRVLSDAGVEEDGEVIGDESYSTELDPRALDALPRWEEALQLLGGRDAENACNLLTESVRALARAKHTELRSRLVLDDTHSVLSLVLAELMTVGRACEKAFPDVARRVVPRPLPPPDNDDDKLGIQ